MATGFSVSRTGQAPRSPARGAGWRSSGHGLAGRGRCAGDLCSPPGSPPDRRPRSAVRPAGSTAPACRSPAANRPRRHEESAVASPADACDATRRRSVGYCRRRRPRGSSPKMPAHRRRPSAAAPPAPEPITTTSARFIRGRSQGAEQNPGNPRVVAARRSRGQSRPRVVPIVAASNPSACCPRISG